jgi:hypothetical protein
MKVQDSKGDIGNIILLDSSYTTQRESLFEHVYVPELMALRAILGSRDPI